MNDPLLTSLIGASEPMARLRALIAKVAKSNLPVLIQGETGSGKELVARALHAASGRTGSLTALNVCAVAEPMFEATLFGHVRGAFTGAVSPAAGYLAEANGGTLFLDEIGGLPPAPQAKLLRAIELKEFRPVGASSDRRSDFRLVAATNEDLHAVSRNGAFRADLLQRLSGMRIHLPPLRERREDIPDLARHFLEQSGRMNGVQKTSLDDGALAALCEYDWPGNVRELRQLLECAHVLGGGATLTRHDILPLFAPVDTRDAIPSRRSHHNERLVDALSRSNWDADAAARELGVHRATVYRRLRRMGHGGADTPNGAELR